MTAGEVLIALKELLNDERLSSDIPTLITEKLVLDEMARDLVDLRHKVDSALGEAMGQYKVEVPNYGLVERTKLKSRAQWDKDALLSAVRDSRVVDKTTGEVKDESPLDKILAVWNLGVPRTTALKERNIDPDEFCVLEERAGWNIRIY